MRCRRQKTCGSQISTYIEDIRRHHVSQMLCPGTQVMPLRRGPAVVTQAQSALTALACHLETFMPRSVISVRLELPAVHWVETSQSRLGTFTFIVGKFETANTGHRGR